MRSLIAGLLIALSPVANSTDWQYSQENKLWMGNYGPLEISCTDFNETISMNFTNDQISLPDYDYMSPISGYMEFSFDGGKTVRIKHPLYIATGDTVTLTLDSSEFPAGELYAVFVNMALNDQMVVHINSDDTDIMYHVDLQNYSLSCINQ